MKSPIADGERIDETCDETGLFTPQSHALFMRWQHSAARSVGDLWNEAVQAGWIVCASLLGEVHAPPIDLLTEGR